jgi:hypothetical protein
VRKKLIRLFEIVTGIHRIHHINYSYGYKIPFMKAAYFPGKVFGKRHGFKGIDRQQYHNCTITGIY